MTTDRFRLRRHSATEPLTKTTIDRRDVGPHDVAFDIQFAGICHSDIHTVRGEWGEANYPVVPGHEIAGIVTEVGSEVTKYKVGDHVGVGCFVDSCRECENCLAGRRAVLQRTRHGRHLQRASAATAADLGRLQRRDRRRRELRAAHPRRDSAGHGRSAAVRGHHHVLAAAALGRRPRQEGRGHRPRRARPHGRQARRRDGRRGHGAQPVAEEDGGRPAARRRRVLRHQRPRHLQEAGRLVRPDPQHRVGQPRHGRLPRPARRSTARWSNSACPRSRWRSRSSRWSRSAAACPAR